MPAKCREWWRIMGSDSASEACLRRCMIDTTPCLVYFTLHWAWLVWHCMQSRCTTSHIGQLSLDTHTKMWSKRFMIICSTHIDHNPHGAKLKYKSVSKTQTCHMWCIPPGRGVTALWLTFLESPSWADVKLSLTCNAATCHFLNIRGQTTKI